MPKCLILVGPPCSGKTTYRDKYCSSYWTLCRDDIRMAMHPGMSYNEAHDAVDERAVTAKFWEVFNVFTKSNVDFVIDNQNIRKGYLREIVNKLPDTYTIEVKMFPVTYLVAWMRNYKRKFFEGKFIPLNYLKSTIEQFNKIKNDPEYLVYIRPSLPSQEHMQRSESVEGGKGRKSPAN